MPLVLVHAWIWQPHDVPDAQGMEAQKHWAQRILREGKSDLNARYPGLSVTTEQIPDLPATVLLDRAENSEMLVLGSRGHSGIAGFLLGSVGQHVLARAKSPVVMVRANERAAAEQAGGEVVVGLQDLGEPSAALLEFAFTAAAARGSVLRAVHAWKLPPVYGYNPAAARMGDQDGGLEARVEEELSDTLRPWREKFPRSQWPTIDLAFASGVVLQAASEAELVVVGRRVHRPVLGMRIGPVTHAVLHHAAAPVAVVPHD